MQNQIEECVAYHHNHVSQQIPERVGNLWGAYNTLTGWQQNAKSHRSEEAKLKSLVLDNTFAQKSFNESLKYMN